MLSDISEYRSSFEFHPTAFSRSAREPGFGLEQQRHCRFLGEAVHIDIAETAKDCWIRPLNDCFDFRQAHQLLLPFRQAEVRQLRRFGDERPLPSVHTNARCREVPSFACPPRPRRSDSLSFIPCLPKPTSLGTDGRWQTMDKHLALLGTCGSTDKPFPGRMEEESELSHNNAANALFNMFLSKVLAVGCETA